MEGKAQELQAGGERGLRQVRVDLQCGGHCQHYNKIWTREREVRILNPA